MLKPAGDRLNYGHLLTPPPDYTADFALGTTYGLDLEALVGVPMALFLSEEMNNSMTSNPIAALEGLRRSSDQFVILCEAGQIKVPKNNNTVFALLEDSVFEVAHNDKSFHPKVWLIRFQGKQKQLLYRIIVLSRNLTFDRSWDLAVCLEGTYKAEPTDKNRPLQDFIEYLRLRVRNRKKRNKITHMIEELNHIHFEPQDQHFTDFHFCPLGIKGYDKPTGDLFDTYTDLLIISPFLSKSTVSEFAKRSLSNASKTLITRREEVAKLTPELLSSFDVYVMKEEVVEGEEGLSGDDTDEGGLQHQDIHAKFYARSKYSRHTFYVGSANCSHSAFNGNVEFLLQLNYRKWGFGIQDLKKELINPDEKENPFEKIDDIPVIEPDPDTVIKDRLEKGIKQLCRAQSKATVQEKEDKYNVIVQFNKIPEDIAFMISPLAGAQKEELTQTTILSDMNLEQLSEFYRIEAALKDVTLERMIKIRTTGIPEDRNKAVFKTIIRDQHTFMKYIAYLLSDNLLLTYLEQLTAERLGSGKWDTTWMQMPVLYENLLTTVSREPERLKEIDRVMQLIDDPDIIPEGFQELYSTFISAAEKVRK